MPSRKKPEPHRLLRFRKVLATLVLVMLLFPFVLQQTFFPFFRFGMFAEPVTRKIQSEYFLLVGSNHESDKFFDLSKFTGVNKSNLDYLLRNYYYRNEVDFLLKQTAELLPEDVPFDSLILLRIVEKDTTTVARLGL